MKNKIKKFSVLVSIMLIAAFCMALPAMAAVKVATFGDQNSSFIYRVVADSDGVITFAQDTGIKYPYEEFTTDDTVTAAQTGTTFVFTGSVISTATLPSAVAGLNYKYIAGTDTKFHVDVQGSDTLIYSVSSQPLDAGDKITSTGTTGDTVNLFAIGTGSWYVDTSDSFTDGD